MKKRVFRAVKLAICLTFGLMVVGCASTIKYSPELTDESLFSEEILKWSKPLDIEITQYLFWDMYQEENGITMFDEEYAAYMSVSVTSSIMYFGVNNNNDIKEIIHIITINSFGEYIWHYYFREDNPNENYYCDKNGNRIGNFSLIKFEDEPNKYQFQLYIDYNDYINEQLLYIDPTWHIDGLNYVYSCLMDFQKIEF